MLFKDGFRTKKFIALLFILLVSLIVYPIVLIFRGLDNIFFPGYKKMKIKDPVFIFGNPRSGSTYFYNLMKSDRDFVSPVLYESLFCSIILYKFTTFIRSINRKIGRPFSKIIRSVEKRFDTIKHIHPVKLNTSEEDENLFIQTLISPSILFYVPFPKELNYIQILDALPKKVREKVMTAYKNSLKRFMYVHGKNKTYFSKNVMAIGRLLSIQAVFPDAKIIYILRDPEKQIASTTSLYYHYWKTKYPYIKKRSAKIQEISKMNIRFYKHFLKVQPRLNQKNLFIVNYSDLKDDPQKIIKDIYKKFGLKLKKQTITTLNKKIKKNKRFKSRHKYSLKEFGLSRRLFRKELRPLLQLQSKLLNKKEIRLKKREQRLERKEQRLKKREFKKRNLFKKKNPHSLT